MIKEETTPLVIDIAKSYVECLQGIDPNWTKGYLRFFSQQAVSEVKGSYTNGSDVSIVNVLKHKVFFHALNDKGRVLLELLGKKQGVFLLTIDANFSYEIAFEYQEMDRWKISKLDGGSGIPEGI